MSVRKRAPRQAAAAAPEVTPAAEVATAMALAQIKPRYRVPAGRSMSVQPPRTAQASAYYDSATVGGRLGGWALGVPTQNGAIQSGGWAVRQRAWWLYRNNAFAKRAVDRLFEAIVGTGPNLRFLTANRDFNRQAEALWKQWAKKSDAKGGTNFGGQLILAMKETLIGMDSFVRFRPRLPTDGLPVPFQLEVMSSDYVPMWFDRTIDNGVIRMGVEMNVIGQRSAYWMLSRNPRDVYGTSLIKTDSILPVRVPASEVLHLRVISEADSIRGESAMAISAVLLKELAEFTENTRIAKRNAALYAGAVYKDGPQGTSPFEAPAQNFDENGLPIGGPNAPTLIGSLDMPPGTIPIFDSPNQKFQPAPPLDVGSGFTPYLRSALQEAAASFGVSYESLTGDWEHINDRTWKAINLEFMRTVNVWRETIITPQILDPIAERFIFLAQQSGALVVPPDVDPNNLTTEWAFQGLGNVNMTAEIQYVTNAVRAGLMSRSQGCEYLGSNAVDVDEQNFADNQRSDGFGLQYDSDPRFMSQVGVTQARPMSSFVGIGNTVNTPPAAPVAPTPGHEEPEQVPQKSAADAPAKKPSRPVRKS